MAGRKRRNEKSPGSLTSAASTEPARARPWSNRPEPVMHPDAWWSVSTIARVIEYSYAQTCKIVCLPDFPRPTHLMENSHPRWKAGEVMKWLESR